MENSIKHSQELLHHKLQIKGHKNKKVRHFKGKEYLILDFAKHTETGDILVIYIEPYMETVNYMQDL